MVWGSTVYDTENSKNEPYVHNLYIAITRQPIIQQAYSTATLSGGVSILCLLLFAT